MLKKKEINITNIYQKQYFEGYVEGCLFCKKNKGKIEGIWN